MIGHWPWTNERKIILPSSVLQETERSLACNFGIEEIMRAFVAL